MTLTPSSHPTRQPPTRSSVSPSNAANEADLQVIFSLPANNTWFENLAYRASTNTFLATRLDVPQIWSIDPTRSGSDDSGTLLANVSAIGALTGITQLQSSSEEKDVDEFLIAGLNFSASTEVLQPNSSAFWKLSFLNEENSKNLSSSPSSSLQLFTLQQAFTVPGIALVNGLATWNESTILAADSLLGAIWRIDIHTGDAVIVSQDPTMAPLVSNGVNGIKVFRPSFSSSSLSTTTTTYIYYTSTDQSLLVRIPVDSITAIPLGPAQVIASDLGEADDFTLVVEKEEESKVGAVLLATGKNNSVVRVEMDGSVVTVAGEGVSNNGSLLLAGATSCRFGGGGGGANEQRLYVTTAGGAESGGALEAPGRVVAVDI